MSRQPITMPVLSDTMSTGRLVRWLKQPGQAVKKGETIAEVESDKAVMDLEAFEDGYLAGPLAAPDSEIPVGEAIGYLADTQEEAQGAAAAAPASAAPQPEEPTSEAAPEPAPAPAEHHEAPAATPEAAKPAATSPPPPPPPTPTPSPPPARQASIPSPSSQVKASPYARGLAAELDIDLSLVASDADGIVRAPQVVAAALAPPVPDLQAGPPAQIQPFSGMQRAVARNMTASLSIPTFRVSAVLPMKALIALSHEQKVSLSLLLARACAMAVGRHPRFNAAYTPQGLAMRERVDVGIAVDVPDGLVTPVIRDVAGRSLDELSEDWRILKDKVKRHRLTPNDYLGATFYLSNLGVFPQVARFDAIVPLGAAAILAIGAQRDGHAEFTLSCDHRVVFGADAARFFETLATSFDSPEKLVEGSLD